MQLNYIPHTDPLFEELGPIENWDDSARATYLEKQPSDEARARVGEFIDQIDFDSSESVQDQLHKIQFTMQQKYRETYIPIPSSRFGGSAQVAGNLEDHTNQLRGSGAAAAAPEPMTPDVDYSLEAAFGRVKQFQIDLYLAQVQHIDALLAKPDTQATYDNLTVHLLSAFLRDVCLDTGLVDLPHLTAAIQEFGNCTEETAQTLAQGIKEDFWAMLGDLDVSTEDIEQVRRDYHAEHVYLESQEHDALWIDTVTKEFIGNLYNKDQETFTNCMSEASEVNGVDTIRDAFKAQRTNLKSLASVVRQLNDPSQIAELIYCYENQETFEYVFEEIVGIDAGILYDMNISPNKRPAGYSHEQWVLARQIKRFQENPDQVGPSMRQQIWSVIKYYPRLMLVDWRAADTEQGFFTHTWGNMRDDFDRLRADGALHRQQEIYDTKIEEEPLEPEVVYEPAQPSVTPGVTTTASTEFKSMFPLNKPVSDPMEQLYVVRDTMVPGFEASKKLLHTMALTGTFGKGAQIPNFMVHMFKLALITYSEFDATADVDSERTRMQQALERFMMLLFGYDDDNTNLAQYFVNAFASMTIDKQPLPEWARANHKEIHKVFGYEVDSIPDLMTIPTIFNDWFDSHVATEPGVFGQLQEIAQSGDTITSFNQTMEPISYIKKQLGKLEEKTEKTIVEMNEMNSPDSIFEFLNIFCPKKEGRDCLLSLIGVNLDATSFPNKPADMTQAQWQHSLNFADQYDRYTGTQGQAQMIGMSVMMCACMAGAFINPVLGMIAMVPMGGISFVDVANEQAKLRRYHSGALTSHQEGQIESSDIRHVVDAQMDEWQAIQAAFVNIAAIALGVHVGMQTEKMSRCGLRIACEAGFGFADGVVATGADGRVARSGAPEQALFMAVAFGMAAGAVGGGMAKRAGAFQAGDTVPSFRRTFDAQVGKLDDGNGGLGVVADIDGEPVSFNLDGAYQAGELSNGHIILKQDGDRQIRLEIIDPNTGEARVTVEQKMDRVVGADEAASVARFMDAEVVIPDARVDAAVRESARPNLDRLLASNVFQGHLEQQRMHNPQGEFEVYQRVSGDPPGIEYLYVHSDEGRGDMGSYLVSTDAEGNPIDIKPTQDGVTSFKQEGWGLLAHAHPATEGTTVMPTADDLVAMMDYGAPEHFILRTDPETGDLHQARVFVQDGQIQIEFGELYLRHVYEQKGYIKTFEEARAEIEGNLRQEFDQTVRQAIEEFRQKPADEVRAVASDPAAETIHDIAIPMGEHTPPKLSSEVLNQHGFALGTDTYNTAMDYIQTCLRSGEITPKEIPELILSMQGADRFQYMVDRYGGSEGFLREAELRSELRVQVRESEMSRLTSDGAAQQAARNARIVVPSVLSIPGEARVMSVADVELVSTYYSRMRDQNPTNEATRIVGENYRSLIVADTSVAGHSADYTARGVDDGFFAEDFPGVRTLDHHETYALGADGTPDARNSTMKMLDVMEEALARHDGNIERAIQELNIGAATTDNLGDGGWCVWIARNQRQILADGSLRSMIREATHFEDVTAFGTTYLGQEGSPALQLQAAIFYEYNRILDEHGIVGTDRFSDAQAASILEQACVAIDKMVADETARAQAADAFFRDVEETAHLASEEAVIQDASVDGQVVFFDTSKLGGASTFTRFLAIPRAHALSMHANCVPLPGNKYLYFVGIPHERSLPSGKNLQDVVGRVRAAEDAKARELGVEPQDVWVAKAEVMFVAKGKTSLLTPQELSAILTDPDVGLFGRAAVSEMPKPDKVTGPLATVVGREGVYRVLDAQDPDNVTVMGPIDRNANQMFRVRLTDVAPLQRKVIDETGVQEMPIPFSHHLFSMRHRSTRYLLQLGSQRRDYGLDLSHETVGIAHAMIRFDKHTESYCIMPNGDHAIWIKRGNDTFRLPKDIKAMESFDLQDGDLIQFGDARPIRFEKPNSTMVSFPHIDSSMKGTLSGLAPDATANPVIIDGAIITRDHKGLYYVEEPGATGVRLLDSGDLITTESTHLVFIRPEFAAGDTVHINDGSRDTWLVVKSDGNQVTVWQKGAGERVVSKSLLNKRSLDDHNEFAGTDYGEYQRANPARAATPQPVTPAVAKGDIVSIEGQEGTYEVVDFKGGDAFVIGPMESADRNLLKFPTEQMTRATVEVASAEAKSMPEVFMSRMVRLQKANRAAQTNPVLLVVPNTAARYGLDFSHESNQKLSVIFSYDAADDVYHLTAMGEGSVLITRDGDSVPVPLSRGDHQVILKDGDVIQFGDAEPFCWQDPERIDLDRPMASRPEENMDLGARQEIRAPFAQGVGSGNIGSRASRDVDIANLSRLTRTRSSLNLGPSKTVHRKIPTVMPDAEIFVAASKFKHHGRIEVMQDPKGKRVIKFTDQATGAEAYFLPEEIIGIRERGDEGYAKGMDLIRVANPHLADKSINASGLSGERMHVFVDYTDPRLQRFFDKGRFKKLREFLDRGTMPRKDVAMAAWQFIREEVKYDHSRLEEGGGPENRLYNLSEFLDEGVCNERGMLLQVALQYLGIDSEFEKGNVYNGDVKVGRHAWVRITDPGIPEASGIFILDPQVAKPLFSYQEQGQWTYVKDGVTPFVRDRAETVRLSPDMLDAYRRGGLALAGADDTGPSRATDTGIISADDMVRSASDPEARMDTGEFPVYETSEPQGPIETRLPFVLGEARLSDDPGVAQLSKAEVLAKYPEGTDVSLLDTDGFVAGTYTVENVDRPAFLVELRNMETGEMHWMEMRDMHDQQVRHASSHEQRVSAETGDTDAADSSGEKKPRLKISADDVRNRQARFEQKRTTYVEENATLSKAEFDALFLGSIRQSNVVGNCGPLATFLSLAAGGENFEAIMRTSIRTTDYGWAVTIPLGKPGGREIKISHANIKTGLHVSLSRKKGQRGLSELDPVSGPQGYQLLEAVLAKLVLGRVDDLQYPVSRRSIEKMRTHVILKKLFGDDVLYTGKKYKGQDTFENPIPGSVCLSSLLAFKPGGKVMTVSIDSGKDSQGNMLPGTFFNYTDLQGSTYNMAAKHFYAITKVNVDSNARPPTVQSVEVVNPHDSSQTMVFPLSDFLNLFDSMQTASIDLNNLFTGGNA